MLGGASTADEYQIKNGKFQKLNRKINIPLKKVDSFTTTSCDDIMEGADDPGSRLQHTRRGVEAGGCGM